MLVNLFLCMVPTLYFFKSLHKESKREKSFVVYLKIVDNVNHHLHFIAPFAPFNPDMGSDSRFRR